MWQIRTQKMSIQQTKTILMKHFPHGIAKIKINNKKKLFCKWILMSEQKQILKVEQLEKLKVVIKLTPLHKACHYKVNKTTIPNEQHLKNMKTCKKVQQPKPLTVKIIFMQLK